MQVQASVDEEVDGYQEQPSASSDRHFGRQDSPSIMPGKEAAAGFKGAFKKVANGIAGNNDDKTVFTIITVMVITKSNVKVQRIDR